MVAARNTACVGLLSLLSSLACDGRPAFVVLTVEDPDREADAATVLRVGIAGDGFKDVKLGSSPVFPAQVTLTTAEAGPTALVVEAVDSNAAVLARANLSVTFRRQGRPTALAVLARACDSALECEGDTFCESAWTCTAGACARAGPVCGSAFECVTSRCLEAERRCEVTVDHGLCSAGEFCSLSAGCAPGLPCLDDQDCDDEDPCNGTEQCSEFQCLPGTPLDIDDGDACTLDGCDGSRVALGLEPVFNAPSPAMDGASCSLSQGGQGVCRFEAGGCWTSVCGDGFLDVVTRNEVCDDGPLNSNDWAFEPHCNATCDGLSPHCGDGQVDAGEEFCDDGPQNDDGWALARHCNETCSAWSPHCGDDVIEPGIEACDDGSGSTDDWSPAAHCNASCTGSAPHCGDGLVSLGNESCDDGPLNGDTWTVEVHCNSTCDGPGEACGDGIIQTAWEECDDGVHEDTGNGCSDTCQDNHVCGDGVLQTLFEECDDGADGDACDKCRDDCTVPCDCDRDDCGSAAWCDQGSCVACDTATHCGPSCASCGGDLPSCGGVVLGCVCDASPAPRGSCGLGTHCSAGACVVCDADTHCGPECVACSGETPVCGGADVGCVVDPASGCAGVRDGVRCQVVTDPDRSYDICSGGVCTSPGCGAKSCNVPLPDFAIADSSQRICYDNAASVSCPGVPGAAACGTTPFCGQDAQYGWDTSHVDSERFDRLESVVDEPVVIDQLTGWMWQGCPSDMRGADCTGGAESTMVWQDAVSYCEQSSWSGYSDWHLPSQQALLSIIDRDEYNPAIDPNVFPATPSRAFWSLSSLGANHAWRVNFTDSRSEYGVITTPYHARCVRRHAQTIAYANPRFSVDPSVPAEPVVADAATGRSWQGCAAGLSGVDCATGTAEPLTWEEALARCESLDWGGQTDWRVPDFIELHSIVSLIRFMPSIDPAIFPATPTERFWSSSSAAGNPTNAEWIEFYSGEHAFGWPKTSAGLVRCVRGGL